MRCAESSGVSARRGLPRTAGLLDALTGASDPEAALKEALAAIHGKARACGRGSGPEAVWSVAASGRMGQCGDAESLKRVVMLPRKLCPASWTFPPPGCSGGCSGAQPPAAAHPDDARSHGRSRYGRPGALLVALLGLSALPTAALLPPAVAGERQPQIAQANLRSTFPGRRIGGATRGECTARLVVHLVPDGSVLAPAGAGIGLLLGPTATPRPVLVELRKLDRGGAPDRQSPPLLRRTLPAAPAGVTLLSVGAIATPTVWESASECGEAAAGTAAGADPLAFVEAAAPPALSLLMPDGGPEDARIQASLRDLRRSCGATVATAELAGRFGLADVVAVGWPERLPVRCP